MNKTTLQVLLFTFLLSGVLFTACEKSDDLATDDLPAIEQNELSQQEIEAIIEKANEDYMNGLTEAFGKAEYFAASNDSVFIYKQSSDTQLKSAVQPYGPYSTTVYCSKIRTNEKLFVRSQPRLATGVYFCDIYQYRKAITLPSQAVFGVVHSINPQGFSNYTDQTPGFYFGVNSSNNNSSNVTLIIITYKIHVRYSITGASVGRVYPSYLNNVNSVNATYTYYAP